MGRAWGLRLSLIVSLIASDCFSIAPRKPLISNYISTTLPSLKAIVHHSGETSQALKALRIFYSDTEILQRQSTVLYIIELAHVFKVALVNLNLLRCSTFLQNLLLSSFHLLVVCFLFFSTNLHLPFYQHAYYYPRISENAAQKRTFSSPSI